MSWSIPQGPRRIVCLTEEPTEILYALGEGDRIVGISAYTVRPPEAKKSKPVVSAFIQGSVPKIKALKPDLIIGFSDIQADLAKDLIRANYPSSFSTNIQSKKFWSASSQSVVLSDKVRMPKNWLPNTCDVSTKFSCKPQQESVLRSILKNGMNPRLQGFNGSANSLTSLAESTFFANVPLKIGAG